MAAGDGGFNPLARAFENAQPLDRKKGKSFVVGTAAEESDQTAKSLGAAAGGFEFAKDFSDSYTNGGQNKKLVETLERYQSEINKRIKEIEKSGVSVDKNQFARDFFECLPLEEGKRAPKVLFNKFKEYLEAEKEKNPAKKTSKIKKTKTTTPKPAPVTPTPEPIAQEKDKIQKELEEFLKKRAIIINHKTSSSAAKNQHGFPFNY